MSDTEVIYRFEVENVRSYEVPTTARIYRGSNVIACVYRRRKTKRSKWTLFVSPTTNYGGAMSLDDYRRDCEAVLALAVHPWGDE